MQHNPASPHLGPVLLAVGHDAAQLRGLAKTISKSELEVLVSFTPADFAGPDRAWAPVLRVRYDIAELESPGLGERVDAFLWPLGLPYHPASPR